MKAMIRSVVRPGGGTRHCADKIGKILESCWKVLLTNGWKEVNQPLENFCPMHVTPNI